MHYPEQIKKLLDLFSRFPGVGPKTAERFIFWLLKQPTDYINNLSANLANVSKLNFSCAVCFNISLSSPCHICKDTRRNKKIICVVEDVADLYAIEQVNEFTGVYHVLGGTLQPINNITPDKLYIKELLEKIKNNRVDEIILATNPTIEGETTALYLGKILGQIDDYKITKLGRGLPHGADIEYADSLTLSQALLGRKEIKNR